MWFLKSLGLIILLVIFLYLAILNMNQTVTLYLGRPGVPTFSNVPLPLALLGAFVLGVFAWFLLSVWQTFSHHLEMSRLRRRNQELLKELTDLRNMPLEGLDTSGLRLPETGDGVRLPQGGDGLRLPEAGPDVK